jgi:hypothetical protein
LRLKKIDSVRFHVAGKGRKQKTPASDDGRIEIDTDARVCGLLVPEDSTASEVRLDVGCMRWKNIDDVLVALSLAARIPHGTIIVIFDGNVKCLNQSAVAKPLKLNCINITNS